MMHSRRAAPTKVSKGMTDFLACSFIVYLDPAILLIPSTLEKSNPRCMERLDYL
jgi:hypothetical protein